MVENKKGIYLIFRCALTFSKTASFHIWYKDWYFIVRKIMNYSKWFVCQNLQFKIISLPKLFPETDICWFEVRVSTIQVGHCSIFFFNSLVIFFYYTVEIPVFSLPVVPSFVFINVKYFLTLLKQIKQLWHRFVWASTIMCSTFRKKIIFYGKFVILVKHIKVSSILNTCRP